MSTTLPSAATTIGDGFLELTGSGTINLGNLSDFLNQTLSSGGITIDANIPGQIAKVKFNGADIVTNFGNLRVLGADARFEDENGNSALRNFAHNGLGAQFRVGWGAPALTLNTAFLNEGHFVVRPGGTAILTNGLTSIAGDGEDGLVEVLATDDGPRVGNGTLVVAGDLANQNATGELNGRFELTSYGSATATLQYNNANITGIGPNSIFILTGPNAELSISRGRMRCATGIIPARCRIPFPTGW